ncbi:protein NUCLEAR FUSION DEFECTIVE 4 isoform X2 [Hevea brasiliensis]|uniref:protein NUCLEAR FUSION DEFECTIVE 4 isoform X2 n=1 Tax=Hevea brasiliensis TaxID=3981 RepID=UPI0025CE672A|nr:protein NUCLEAR FUSION DEFECTIVE 4 isoform X2 [Hevea brasiliensis]
MKAGTRPPWIGLGVAVWVQIASGNAYSFPLYSHSLKSVLGFNQHQLTMVGVANDIGENIGLLPGIASNKFPPWAILLIGAFACFIGYGVLWLALSRAVQSMPYWLLWLALCVATNSSAWLSTAVLVTNMRNFPLSRGTVAGILKGYGGISAAVFTAIYSMLLHSSSSKLLMFLALGIPVLCFLVMYFVRACTPASGEDSTEHAYFLFTQAALIALSLYILITTILDHMLHLSAPISYTFPVIMFVLLMAPLAIPIKMTFCCTRTSKSGMLDRSIASSDNLIQGEASADKTEPLLKSSSSALILGSFQESDETSVAANMLLAEGEGAVKKKRRPKRGEDFKFSEAVIKADFWLLFFVYFVGVGSGVTVLNNLAQIGIAQGVHDTTILLSLFSFCNFVGRLGGGTVSEHFVRSKTIPRTIWMTCTQIIMIVTYLLFASAIDGLLAGYVYDTEAAKQQELNMLLGSSISCMGPHCFRLTFLVLAGVCGVGSILSLILTMRIWPVYEMLYAGGSFRLPQSSIH